MYPTHRRWKSYTVGYWVYFFKYFEGASELLFDLIVTVAKARYRVPAIEA